jgi:uncharacterized membrane-anchored protein YhcB (DUF1043 family)
MFRKLLRSKEGMQMNDLVKLVIDVIKGALKIRPSFEVKEGTKIQEELDGLKEELEKELQNRDNR